MTEKSEEYLCYPAAGVLKARLQNAVILVFLLIVSSVVLYYYTVLMLKTERRDNFYFATLEILFVLGVIGIAYKAVTKRMAYILSPTALYLQYGKRVFKLAYHDIKSVQILKKTEIFDGDLRAGGRSKLFRPWGVLNEAILFTSFNHLRHGKICICATTKADEFLMLTLNDENTPALIIAAQDFNIFLNDLKSRLVTTTSLT